MIPVTSNATVVDRFLSAAERYPDAIAARDRRDSTTYRALRAWTAAIAGRLVDAGAGPGDVVAVCMNRGVATVAALFGVLSAGCVYLPIDPDWPDGRIREVVTDAGVRCAVTDDDTSRRPPLADLRLITPQYDDGDAKVPESRATSSGGAYLLYTSGSTGKPKGVHVGHRALLHVIDAMLEPSCLAPGRCALASTTTTFDISLVELILPVCFGATCVVADSDTVRDPAALAEFVAAWNIDYVQATPTLWAPLLDQLSVRIPVAMCAGEPLSALLRDRLLAASHHALNGYGPTETTIYATIWPLEPDVPVSVGRPLGGVRVWVLDDRGIPCAPGVTGKVYISGITVADGYLNRPELTAERFRDGIGNVTAERAYDVGDLAFWGADGLLYVQGREDDQIKLRGFRIEPGEIEAVLGAVEGVAAAVVVPFSRGRDQRSLVAFVQAADRRGGPGERRELEAALRARAADRLPQYMRPHMFQFVDAIPLTATGKADRRALTAMVRVPDHAAAAPCSGGHERIAELFREVLGSAGVSADDNFFDLGGDSIGAVLLVAKLRKTFDTPLTLRAFVAAPTVRGMAALVGAE
jgi:amino acid adenylation domain-containing protein